MVNRMQRKLMTVQEYAEVSGIHQNTLYLNRHHGNEAFIKIQGKWYIDTYFLERRKEFREKVWHQCHVMYYQITEHITEYRLGVLLSRYDPKKASRNSWVMFMRETMFSLSLIEGEGLTYKITDKMWFFFRFTRALIRALNRKESLREAKILERLPNRDRYDEIYKERGCSRDEVPTDTEA